MENNKEKVCLIVEGGGFKTGFTSGVIDAFMVSRYNPFDSCIGISGGSVVVSYFLSRQYRYCLNAMLLLAEDKNFTNYKRTFGEQGYMDIEYIKRVAEREVPFEINNALNNCKNCDIRFVATHRKSGNPTYLIPNNNNWMDTVVSSCAVPFLSKAKHRVGDDDYFDGGWSDPIPVKYAYKNGVRKIILVRTWPSGNRTKQSWADYFGSIYFSSHPGLKKVFESSYKRYNKAINFIANPPQDLTIHEIAPIKLLKSTTYSYSRKTIMRDYRYGLDLGMQYVAQQRFKNII